MTRLDNSEFNALPLIQRRRINFLTEQRTSTPEVQPNIDSPSFGESFAATWRTQNLMGSFGANRLSRIIAGFSPFHGDPSDIAGEWFPDQYLTDKDFYDQHPYALQGHDVLSGTRGEYEFMLQLEILRQGHEDYQTMARTNGLLNFALSAGVNIADPTNLIPIGALVKSQKGFSVGKMLLNVSKAASVGAITNLIQEEALHAMQPGRPVDRLEADLYAIGAGAVFGGLIGFLASPNWRASKRGINKLVPTDDIRQAKINTEAMFQTHRETLTPYAENLKAQAIKNNVPDDMAHNNAALHDAFFDTMQEHTGTPREELINQHQFNFAEMADDISETYYQDKRGVIYFKENGQSVVKLFEMADNSTLAHESGHFFLRTFGKLAENEKASPVLKQDWDAIKSRLGVDSLDNITREGHEKFANGLLTYLQDGKAPSFRLKGVFKSFKT